jgi:glutamyl-tRNA synthetase
MSGVRTRFPPSPTGHLHIGGARTALFNYLYARHEAGRFVLRVEDTDRERSTAESIAGILDSLRWLGLDWDEGPFFQSERYPLYAEHVERLLAAGKAYRCYCTPEELDARRKADQAAGRKPAYDRTCRQRTDHPSRPHAVRFAMPVAGETVVHDLIRGTVVVQNAELDDLVIARSDGSPTYNFCVVVDDALMAISHVIRGEDHLANTPKQIQIYQALGYPLPAFAHVPLVHGLDRARLSKRHGATSVTAYRDMGYLPDALLNYLVRLGWSYGDQEIFTRAELIEKFSLDRCGSAAGVFNPEKLEWVNFQHLKRLSPPELAAAAAPFIAARGSAVPGDVVWLQRALVTLQERAKTLVELVDFASFYLCDEVTIDPKAAAKHLATADPAVLRALHERLVAAGEWTEGGLKAAFEAVLTAHHVKLADLAQPVRVALTGGSVSPGIFEVACVLGRERVLRRLERALALAGTARLAAAGP